MRYLRCLVNSFLVFGLICATGTVSTAEETKEKVKISVVYDMSSLSVDGPIEEPLVGFEWDPKGLLHSFLFGIQPKENLKMLIGLGIWSSDTYEGKLLGVNHTMSASFLQIKYEVLYYFATGTIKPYAGGGLGLVMAKMEQEWSVTGSGYTYSGSDSDSKSILGTLFALGVDCQISPKISLGVKLGGQLADTKWKDTDETISYTGLGLGGRVGYHF